MKIAILIHAGAMYNAPLGGAQVCRDIIVRAEGEEPESLTLYGYNAKDFPYKPGAILLLHLVVMDGIPAVYKLTCIGYDYSYSD